MISRSIREGFRGVARHWAMAISSAIAVTITLLIISLFLIFTYHLQRFTRSFEQEAKIAVQISYDYESEEEEQRIKNEIAAVSGVKKVTYSSKEEEFDFFIARYEDERTREVFESYREENPLHDAYYVETDKGSVIAEAADKIREIEGVENVDYGGQSTVKLVAAMTSVRRGGAILVAGLSILAIFLIQNTIKLTIHARQDEITIMRNVGAANSFIRSPFLWEGVIIGIIGSIVPVGLTIWLYELAFERTGGVIISSIFHLVKPFPFVYYVAGIMIAVGILVGLVGSWISINRYLRWRR
ncbi:MAG: permease-like cell division protein FtsX [Solobacterium sp.]|nr:permease-like cell division protein FtsX [Solobacterium sp.]